MCRGSVGELMVLGTDVGTEWRGMSSVTVEDKRELDRCAVWTHSFFPLFFCNEHRA